MYLVHDSLNESGKAMLRAFVIALCPSDPTVSLLG